MRHPLKVTFLASSILLGVGGLSSADERTQYPPFLAKAYFDVGVGYIDYPFSARQLEPGFEAESVHVPHAAARVVLFGYRFNEHLAAQLSYMRPVQWVSYDNVNGVPAKRTVWMNLAGVTLRGTLPLKGPFSIVGEGGFGIVTRRGFEQDDVAVIKDANYGAPLFGGGLKYRLNPSWDLGLNATYSPSNEKYRQPHTLLFTGGFTHNLRPLPEERVQANAQAGFIFPGNLLEVSYANDFAGFGINGFVTRTVPIFWGGLAQVREGFGATYQRNVFHTRRVFSLDFGVNASYWTSRFDRRSFYAASVFPEFRFTPLRFRAADIFFTYSLAGPTVISRVVIDGNDTGAHFTFHDSMGVGAFAGKGRRVSAQIKIGHYSNGNLLPANAGVSIPLTFGLGYTF